MLLLREKNYVNQASLLFEYLSQLQEGDLTNREGYAAKVYFNAIFGNDFTRQSPSIINSALDYGYGLLLSMVNKEIAAAGYSPNMGINHNNEFNHFNLSCDLMEPFRPLVDRRVLDMNLSEFGTEQKHQLQQMLISEVIMDGKKYTLNNALTIYVRSVLAAIENGTCDTILFYEL